MENEDAGWTGVERKGQEEMKNCVTAHEAPPHDECNYVQHICTKKH